MNLLNKLFNKNNNVSEKGEALKKRLSECVQHEDRTTGPRDHVNPQEYMEHLAKLKSNPEEYDLEVYSAEMDACLPECYNYLSLLGLGIIFYSYLYFSFAELMLIS